MKSNDYEIEDLSFQDNFSSEGNPEIYVNFHEKLRKAELLSFSKNCSISKNWSKVSGEIQRIRKHVRIVQIVGQVLGEKKDMRSENLQVSNCRSVLY